MRGDKAKVYMRYDATKMPGPEGERTDAACICAGDAITLKDAAPVAGGDRRGAERPRTTAAVWRKGAGCDEGTVECRTVFVRADWSHTWMR